MPVNHLGVPWRSPLTGRNRRVGHAARWVRS